MDWLVIQRKHPISLLWNSKQRQPVHMLSLEAPVKCKSAFPINHSAGGTGDPNEAGTKLFWSRDIMRMAMAADSLYHNQALQIPPEQYQCGKLMWWRVCARHSTAPLEMHTYLRCFTREPADTHQAGMWLEDRPGQLATWWLVFRANTWESPSKMWDAGHAHWLAGAVSLEMETLNQFHSRSSQFSKGAEFIIWIIQGRFIHQHQDMRYVS